MHLAAPHWGRGLADEAARAVMAYAFDHLGAVGLVAGHHPENRASQRTIEKLGMRSVRHEVYQPTGLEHRVYALTAAEFRR